MYSRQQSIRDYSRPPDAFCEQRITCVRKSWTKSYTCPLGLYNHVFRKWNKLLLEDHSKIDQRRKFHDEFSDRRCDFGFHWCIILIRKCFFRSNIVNDLCKLHRYYGTGLPRLNPKMTILKRNLRFLQNTCYEILSSITFRMAPKLKFFHSQTWLYRSQGNL